MSRTSFDRVIGYSSVKRTLEQIVDILINKEVYKKLGVTPPKGLLLHGKPGVGKTLMISCLIEASGYKYYILRKNQPNGDFIRSIKECFDEAAKNAPCIVFLDDLDKFSDNNELVNPEEYVTIQSCIDEVRDKEVFVVATANNKYVLPPSLCRAGRFDRIIEITPPEGQDAVDIVAYYLRNKQIADDINPEAIARILNGHSCAQLETIINEAGSYAGFKRDEKITMDHFRKAYLRSFYDIPLCSFEDNSNIDLSDSSDVKTLTIYHESGHAVVSEILCPESITLVTFFNTNDREGGITKYCCNNNNKTFRSIEKDVISTLAGMAAVDKKFGIRDIGTRYDLDKAFSMVGIIVSENCTSGLTLYHYGHDASNETNSRRECVISAEIERYYFKAKEILSQNADFFEKVAAELAKKKILDSDDIKRIKSECSIIPASI